MVVSSAGCAATARERSCSVNPCGVTTRRSGGPEADVGGPTGSAVAIGPQLYYIARNVTPIKPRITGNDKRSHSLRPRPHPRPQNAAGGAGAGRRHHGAADDHR